MRFSAEAAKAEAAKENAWSRYARASGKTSGLYVAEARAREVLDRIWEDIKEAQKAEEKAREEWQAACEEHHRIVNEHREEEAT